VSTYGYTPPQNPPSDRLLGYKKSGQKQSLTKPWDFDPTYGNQMATNFTMTQSRQQFKPPIYLRSLRHPSPAMSAAVRR
jgi:hypothetical protein